MLGLEDLSRLPKQRKCMRADFVENDPMQPSLRIPRIARPVTGCVTGHEIFELAQILPARGGEPQIFRLGDDDRNERSHRREAQHACLRNASFSRGRCSSARATRIRSCAVRGA